MSFWPNNNHPASPFSAPNCWPQLNGKQSHYAVKDDDGKIMGFPEKWNNGYYSRSTITTDVLDTRHVLFLGDSYVFGHGVKNEDCLSEQFMNNHLDTRFGIGHTSFNLAIPGTSNDFSLLRLQQWCNLYGDKVYAVYIGITDILRTCHWEAIDEWNWDTDVSKQNYENINYIPNNPISVLGTKRRKELQNAYETLTSKIDALSKFENVLHSIANLSKVHNFKVYFFNTLQILNSSEVDEIIVNLKKYDNIIYNTANYDKQLDAECYIPNDGHWSVIGNRVIANEIYNNTRSWYEKEDSNG